MAAPPRAREAAAARNAPGALICLWMAGIALQAPAWAAGGRLVDAVEPKVASTQCGPLGERLPPFALFDDARAIDAD